MRPQPTRRMPPRAARTVAKGVTALIVTVCAHSSVSVSPIGAIGPNVPAALTRMLTSPELSRTDVIAASACRWSTRSAAIHVTSPPPVRISRARSSNATAERPTRATRCPQAASRRAMAAPMVPVAPVTTATREVSARVTGRPPTPPARRGSPQRAGAAAPPRSDGDRSTRRPARRRLDRRPGRSVRVR